MSYGRDQFGYDAERDKKFEDKPKKPNWTPGPWKIAHFSVVGKNDRLVANCGGYQTNFDEDKIQKESRANTLLISAAPELYEAVKAVEWNGFDSQENGDICPVCCKYKVEGHAHNCKLNAALKKARGEK
jgi:hypothetical protein